MKALLLTIRHFVAFGIDGLIFTLLSFPVALYFWLSGLDARAASRAEMVLLWMWLVYFVIFEWLYAGTIGKFILRLAVKRTDGTRLSLMTTFYRVGLSFLIPCVLSVFITLAILFFNSSQVSQYGAIILSISVLAALPISILIFGGQSIADVVLHTCVVPVGANTAKTRIIRHPWSAISLLSLLVGVLISWMIGLSNQMMFGTNDMNKGQEAIVNGLPPDLLDLMMPSHNQRFTAMTDIRGKFVREPHQNGEGRSLVMGMSGNADSLDELLVMRRIAFYMSDLPDAQRPDCMPVTFQKDFDAVLTSFRQEHVMVVCDVPKGQPDKAKLIDRGIVVTLRWKVDVWNMLVLMIGRSGDDLTRLAPHNKVK
jgi:uncharacterized RDD family membrane protein YckC